MRGIVMSAAAVALATLGGCSGEAPASPAGDGTDVRAGIRAVAVAGCTREFRDKGMSEDGVRALCPCVADEVVAAAPTAEALADLPAEAGEAAIRTCLERIAPGMLSGAASSR
jgi:hypothetical protein